MSDDQECGRRPGRRPTPRARRGRRSRAIRRLPFRSSGHRLNGSVVNCRSRLSRKSEGRSAYLCRLTCTHMFLHILASDDLAVALVWRRPREINASVLYADAQEHLEACFFADPKNMRRYVDGALGHIDTSSPDEIKNPKLGLVSSVRCCNRRR